MTKIQKIALTIAVLGFCGGSSTLLTDVLSPFGSSAPVIVKEIVSLSTLISGVLGVVLSFMTGQGSQVDQVQNMPGVERVIINKKANQTLAKIAMDPDSKVEATPEAAATVAATAKAG